MKSSSFLSTLTLSLLLVTCAACGGEDTSTTDASDAQMSDTESSAMGSEDNGLFSDWDSDGNGELGESEFEEGFGSEGFFDDWDSDSDGIINEDEYYSGVYNTWDADGDGIVTDSEYSDGTGWLFDDSYEYGYDDWDADGNGELVESEFEEGWSDYGNGLYDDWDADGSGDLADTEFYDAAYGLYDDNGDGVIDQNEYMSTWNYWTV